MRSGFGRPFVAAVIMLGVGAVAHADPTDRAERLAALRAEVETLGHTLTLEQAELAARLQTLALSRSELEVAIRQDELQLAQLQLEIDALRAEDAGDDGAPLLAEAARDGIARLRPLVVSGLPYRVPERLAALDELAAGLDSGAVAPHRAVGRLWQTWEDELRLGAENAIDRQTIRLGGDEVLVDVARVGRVALFFRTADGRVGWAERSGDGWGWTLASDREGRGQVLALFDALDKQIRVGAFTLPDAFPELTR